ncbi:Protein gp8 [Niallia circulans]|jgi:hypothetical protein|uniref:hypothetical protein n=2 Tax=Niallia circulans TaxID=1397 RepID=UPI000A492D7C|nr:hypothetical protein [Niallia circulans]MED3841677.1 hypothetical protein [Niallia circulans]MED4248282.1 hypothetical protein [Niallia circulans]NRG32909.1 hypothetical protein [Niallia circulans]QKH62331.1 hypothetical protein FOC77_17610 [Niallia circulans]SPT86130.1 Protein gp8 [Niallia circulans]
MMAYIDKQYYDDVYKGTEVDEVTFNRLSERGSEIVDEITGYKLKQAFPFDKLNAFFKEQVKKATAAQVEYMILQGEGVEHGDSDISSVTIGKFNYSEGQNPTRLTREQLRTSPAVISYLKPTGLLYNGIDVNG